MTDPIDAAIAQTDQQYTVKMLPAINVAITTEAGQRTGVSFAFPADLDYEVLAAAAAALLQHGHAVIASKPTSGLTLVKGNLPRPA